MDKLIHRVEKDVKKKKLGQAKKDIKTLLKADKKYDKELDECHKMKKHKRK